MAIEPQENIKDVLAATLVHEMKNPLSLLQANISYMELCDEENKYSKNFEVMRRQLHTLEVMFSNFIDEMNPAKRECRAVNNFKEQIDVEELVTDLIIDYEDCSEIPIDFLLHKTKSKIYVLCDKSDLKRLFRSILENAVQAIVDSGKINIILSTVENNLVFEVRDDGKGLSDEVLQRIKNGDTFTTKTYGNGLGIRICRKMVLDLKGTYEIGNIDSGGCSVKITLPIIES